MNRLFLNDAIAESHLWPSIVLTPRQLCDLELLAVGGLAPLTTFMDRADYYAVLATMRLANGSLWPIPVMLDLTDETLRQCEQNGGKLLLRDTEGTVLAVYTVTDTWKWDLAEECEHVYGTTKLEHPGVAYLTLQTNPWYAAGTLELLQVPSHFDYLELRRTPIQVREEFKSSGWDQVVGFQTRNPLHRAHFELTLHAMARAGGNLLLHPVVGLTKPGDTDYHSRVQCYKAIMPRYPVGKVLLSLLPLAMRMAGPREALWHGLIRANYGCTHFVIGRDHAGPGTDATGKPWYEPFEAHTLVKQFQDDLTFEPLFIDEIVYLPTTERFVERKELKGTEQIVSLSGTQVRALLSEGKALPEWFTFSEVAQVLSRSVLPLCRRGVCIFFTGLPSAGKSTLARALEAYILEHTDRGVTLLDGDVVRTMLSSELGFSRAHRDLNIQRIGYVAAEVVRHNGVVLCAPIAPFDVARKKVRRMVEEYGTFFLVHVATPLAVCEARDPKGLYLRARSGELLGVTGIDDPYEVPNDAELVLDSSSESREITIAKLVTVLDKFFEKLPVL